MIPGMPDSPGCYLFKDAAGAIIYVGKAKSLRKRVASYSRPKDPKTMALVGNIADADFMVTSSETEALLLENNLIKKHQPKYNINLRDSRRYAYLMVTDEEYPRVLLSREGGQYGPFISSEQRDTLLKLTRALFGIRTCNRMPKRACLRYHIGLCSAPCIGAVSKEEYLARVAQARQVLSGKMNEVKQGLARQMKDASAGQDFEQALLLRNKLYALEGLTEKQNVERTRGDEHIINILEDEGTLQVMLFGVKHGVLEGKQEFSFHRPNGLEEFLTQYYAEEEPPRLVVLPEQVSDAAKAFLRQRGARVMVPAKGARRELLDLVLENLRASVHGGKEQVIALQKALGMQESPSIMECFDISHIQGSAMVGSMVRFSNGRPDKSNYRRFKIRTVEGVDDFAAIAEIVTRRYRRLLMERQQMPDLVVIDGGAGQLSSALSALKALGLQLPIIGLAKRNEEVVLPGERMLRWDKHKKELHLLQAIRDEAHRFALSYHRLLRRKALREAR